MVLPYYAMYFQINLECRYYDIIWVIFEIILETYFVLLFDDGFILLTSCRQRHKKSIKAYNVDYHFYKFKMSNKNEVNEIFSHLSKNGEVSS